MRILTLALLLAGCSSTTISFDRGAFALLYADTAHVIRTACEKKQFSEADCATLAAADAQIRAAIATPSKDVDWAQVYTVMGAVAKLAGKAAL